MTREARGLRAPAGRKLTWHFQKAVPLDLQEAFGARVVQVSLKTRDKAEAQRRAIELWSTTGEQFEEVRKGSLSPDGLRANLRAFVNHQTV